ncbi:MAG: fibronectin type III domain-containing protein [Paludibacter sp.]|nr:fibronectin type III domain-containing protein [Paludibacter sp.]
MKRKVLFISVFIFCIAEYNFSQTIISSIGNPILQDFNALESSSSSGAEWIDGTTLPVWYAYLTTVTPSMYYVNDGSAVTTGRLYSYGSTGDSDRGLGIIPGGNTGDYSYIGWRLKNNTGKTIMQLKVAWTCEQWKVTTSSQQYIRLYYKLNSYDLSSSGTQVAVLGSPKYSASAGAVLNGNLSENRVSTTTAISLGSGLQNGSEITLIWGAPKQPGASQQLAIDDIAVTAQVNQTIGVLQNIPVLTYGDGQINLNDYFKSSGDLPLTYSSGNTSVAKIVNDSMMSIVGPGSVTIYANQSGNEYYTAANQNSQTVSVNPAVPEMDAASNITQTAFDATWFIDNGLNNSSTTYIFQYSTNPDIQAAIDDDDGTAFTVSDIADESYSLTGLAHNTLYHYRVFATTTGLYSDYSTSLAVTTGDNYVSIHDGDWDADSNWDIAYSPNPYGNNVIINSTITASDLPARDSIVVNELLVSPTGKLENYEIINVTGALIIESDAAGKTGQILNMNEIHLGPAAKIIFRKKFSASYGWYFIGFPYEVTENNIYLGSTSVPATWGDPTKYGTDSPKKTFYVYEYDGEKRDRTGLMNASAGLNWIDDSDHIFDATKGYSIATLNDTTIDFVINASRKESIFESSATSTVGLFETNGCNCHQSWNLVTIPFVSSYDLKNSPNQAPYYIYNRSTNGYDVYMSDESYVVSPYQSFFLQAQSTSFNFVNAGRVMKAKAVSKWNAFDEFSILFSNSSYSDITRIRLEDGASKQYIIGEDAAKFLSSNESVPQIYSGINGFPAAVNTLPANTDSLDLSTKVGKAGEYTITLELNSGNPNSYQSVILIDKVTGKRVDLLKDSYTFTENTTGTSSRFRVVFVSGGVSSVETNRANNIYVTVSNGKAVVKGLTDVADVSVSDVTGKQINQYRHLSNGESIDLPFKGIYILNFKSVADGDAVVKVINN